jgi:hypothetical protein
VRTPSDICAELPCGLRGIGLCRRPGPWGRGAWAGRGWLCGRVASCGFVAPAGGSVWVVGNPGGVTFPWLVSEFVWVSGAGSRAFRVAAGSVCDGAGGALLARALAPGGKTLVRVVVDSEFFFPPYICTKTGGY